MSDTYAGLRVSTPSGLDLPKWIHYIFIVGFFVLGLVCFTQTEWFVSWLPGPTEQSLIDGIKTSSALQESVAKATNAEPQKEPLRFARFSDKNIQDLKDAYAWILEDKELEERFNKRFQVSFKKLRILVLPEWKLDEEGWEKDTELTQDQGWREFLVLNQNPRYYGMTIREKLDGKHRRTLYGTTVVVLKHNVFATTDTLRFYFFHELVHSLNLPGWEYKIGEFPYIREQTDLVYLSDYNWFTAKYGLCGYGAYTPAVASVIFIVLSVSAFAWLRSGYHP